MVSFQFQKARVRLSSFWFQTTKTFGWRLVFSVWFLFTIQWNKNNKRCPHYQRIYLCIWQLLQIKKRHHSNCLAWSSDSYRELFLLLLLVNINLGFFCLFWRWNDTKLCFFFLLWACWNKFQHGRRPLGWFFKHAIASLWRLGDAVKLAKLGTRTQKNRPKPARDYLFKYTLGVTLSCACLFVVFYKDV